MPEIAVTQAPAHIRMGSNIGQPLTRREGVLKTTGAARYAADNHPPGMVYAALAVSSIARGRVTALDVAAAKAHPGVIEVMTPANAPRLALDPDAKDNPFMFRMDVLQNDKVRYANQPIAVVVADTLEAATEGAILLAPRYETEPARTGLDSDDSFAPQYVGPGMPAEDSHGDVEAGLAAASVRVEAVYETPAQYHNALEPHAIVAAWDGDTLSIDTPSQGMAMAQARIAGLFGIAPESIHIRSPFLGGGFGSKGLVKGPQILGIMAARLVGRPVKLVLRREQMFGPVGHRAPTRQTLRLGADEQGRLTALSHHAKTATSTFDDFIEPAANASHALYASPAISTSHEAVRIDTGTPLFMRAPGEAPGSAALESAIDEMALACGMDPLAFRLKNYAEVEPMSGKPFSSKALRQCYQQGAERFGWAGRPLAPRQMRDEAGMLVGWGMGTALFPAIMFQGHARAALRRDGSGVVEIGAHDMGQGAWTALAQIAADALGLDPDRLEFRSGTSDLPDAGIAGGSAHTATAGAAIHDAGGERDRQTRGPGNGRPTLAAVRLRQCRRDRAGRPAAPPRRRSAERELCRHPDPRRGGRDRGSRNRRGRSGGAIGLCHVRAWGSVRRGEGGPGFWPNAGDPAGRRVRFRHGRQSADGPQPVLRRHDLGRVLRAARTRRDRQTHRPPDEPEPRRISCPGERGRAEHRGDPGRRTRRPRKCARYQGRGRDRDHGHCGRHRQRGLARDRRARPSVPDHAGPSDGSLRQSRGGWGTTDGAAQQREHACRWRGGTVRSRPKRC